MTTDTEPLSPVPGHTRTVQPDPGNFCSREGLMTPGGRCPDGCDHAAHYSNDGHPECEDNLREILAPVDQLAQIDPSDPTSWLTYQGDVRANVPDVLGPDQNGELRYPVIASYDAITDTTRVGLSKMVPTP